MPQRSATEPPSSSAYATQHVTEQPPSPGYATEQSLPALSASSPLVSDKPLAPPQEVESPAKQAEVAADGHTSTSSIRQDKEHSAVSSSGYATEQFLPALSASSPLVSDKPLAPPPEEFLEEPEEFIQEAAAATATEHSEETTKR